MSNAQNTLTAFAVVSVMHPDGGIADTGQVIEDRGDGYWLFSSDSEPFAEYEVHASRLRINA